MSRAIINVFQKKTKKTCFRILVLKFVLFVAKLLDVNIDVNYCY